MQKCTLNAVPLLAAAWTKSRHMMRNFFTLQNYIAVGEKAMLILMAILKLLIHKIPEDPQPEDHFRIGI